MCSEGGGGGRRKYIYFYLFIKMASVFKLPDVNVYVCVWGGGGGERNNVFTLLKRLFKKKNAHYTYDLILLPFSSTVSLSVHDFSCDWN